MLRANSAESSTESPTRSEKVGPCLGLPNNNNETNVHICQLCSRAFDSTQALGGHQNAHRRERNHVLAKYIRNRLELITKINGNNFEIGEPSSRRVREVDNEAESVSLELTLAVGGDKGAGESGDMNYNYPDVLFPASEFMDKTVDLDLKLSHFSMDNAVSHEDSRETTIVPHHTNANNVMQISVEFIRFNDLPMQLLIVHHAMPQLEVVAFFYWAPPELDFLFENDDGSDVGDDYIINEDTDEHTPGFDGYSGDEYEYDGDVEDVEHEPRVTLDLLQEWDPNYVTAVREAPAPQPEEEEEENESGLDLELRL